MAFKFYNSATLVIRLVHIKQNIYSVHRTLRIYRVPTGQRIAQTRQKLLFHLSSAHQIMETAD